MKMNHERHDKGIDLDPFSNDEHLQITRKRTNSNYGELAVIKLEK